jgi:hypothetical protein
MRPHVGYSAHSYISPEADIDGADTTVEVHPILIK